MKSEEEFHRLIVERYRQNLATDEELVVFYQLLSEQKLDKYLGEAISDEFYQEAPETKVEFTEQVQPKRIFAWSKIAAAAGVLILLGFFFVNKFFSRQSENTPIVKSVSPVNDALPGGANAVLVLDDGSIIQLNQARNGRIAEQHSATVLKTADGQLLYDAVESGSTTIQFNTLQTPKGGMYALTLSDGTKVWLNAQSSIHFPTAFSGVERRVKITGEAYFDVAHDDNKKFVVEVGNTLVEDLGTAFNISAYSDEPEQQVTLVEGLALVRSNDQSLTLYPGQKVNTEASRLEAKAADVESVTAWKQNDFYFNNEDINAILRQLARWYNLEIVYKTKKPEGRYSGMISRTKKLSEVLLILESGGMKFSLENKRLYIE